MRLPRRSKQIPLVEKSTRFRCLLVQGSHRSGHDERNEWRYPRPPKNCWPSSRSVGHQNRPRMAVRERGSWYCPRCSDDQAKCCSERQSSLLPSQNHQGRKEGQSTCIVELFRAERLLLCRRG